MCSPLLPPCPSPDNHPFTPLTSQPQLTSPPPSRSPLVNMNWPEPLDFSSSSSYPLTSSLHMSSGSYPFNSSPIPFEHMSSLERDYCSNFTCCGLHLSDLHSLLEHFEEAHVVVIDNAGNPVFPRTKTSEDFDNFYPLSAEAEPHSDHSAAAYPYTSLVCDYPQLDPQPMYSPQYQLQPQSEPVSPIEVESPTPSAYYPLHTFLDHDHAIEDRDSLADLDAFPSDNSFNSPTSKQPLALPPSSFATDTQYHRGDLPLYKNRNRGSYKSRILGTKPRPQLRRREKSHKCPTPGCSKSYLNPNGLKYHVEKGTCKIEL